MWTMLLLTLPTQPNAVRLRVWRALKALGSAALRDGVYLLPSAQAARFDAPAEEARVHGGSASLWQLAARNETQQAELLALFDRGEAYAAWREQRQALAAELEALGETDARRRLRTLAQALQALRDIDYFPGHAAEQAEAELQGVREAVDARHSRGEPRAAPLAGLTRLHTRDFLGRTWATRSRPWVDRLACAWLIRRFIDPQARLLWLDDPADCTPPPTGALGYDYDGAEFTHVGSLVSFEVLATRFDLDTDPALQRIARAVHLLDVGGIPVPEAPGLEAVLAGLREVHSDDDRLAAAAAAVFDAFYAAPGNRA
jgi:hypothetical protein